MLEIDENLPFDEQKKILLKEIKKRGIMSMHLDSFSDQALTISDYIDSINAIDEANSMYSNEEMKEMLKSTKRFGVVDLSEKES